MSNSSRSDEQPSPLNDRSREWTFRLLYAHAVSATTLARLHSLVDANFTMSDADWETIALQSKYLPDPRDGQVAESAWDRIKVPVQGALEGLQSSMLEVEEAVQKASPRWRLDRMPIIDRVLLLLGAYELLIKRATPAKRVINRTVELAKRYGGPDSRRFVNGILDQLRRDHGIEAH